MTYTTICFPYEEMPLKRQTQARVKFTHWRSWETQDLGQILCGQAVNKQMTDPQACSGQQQIGEHKGNSTWAMCQLFSHIVIQRGKGQFVAKSIHNFFFHKTKYLMFKYTASKKSSCSNNQPLQLQFEKLYKGHQEVSFVFSHTAIALSMKDKIKKSHFSKDRGYSLLNKTSHSCQYILIYKRANSFFISGRKNCLDYDISNSITHVYKDAIKEVDLSIPNRSGKKLLFAQNFPLIHAMHRLQCQG